MNRRPPGKTPGQDSPSLKVTTAGDVPSFACIVYVRPSEDGGVTARVANLDGIVGSGGTERDAMAVIVPAFKQRVAALLGEGETIPWIDPPPPPGEDEQKRFIPVHL